MELIKTKHINNSSVVSFENDNFQATKEKKKVYITYIYIYMPYGKIGLCVLKLI